jgi:CRP-like cAMP-binding protein
MYEILRGYVSTYANLLDDEFDKLTALLEVRQVPRKTKLVDIGGTENYLNFIVKGLIRKYFIKNNDEVITQIAQENDLVSSSVSFLSGKPSMYVVETIEDSTLLSITRQGLDKLYAFGPRMDRLGRMVITELFLQKELWEHDQVRLTTRERFVNFVHDNPELLQRVPQKYLASYLNIKPETFSRMKHLL